MLNLEMEMENTILSLTQVEVMQIQKAVPDPKELSNEIARGSR